MGDAADHSRIESLTTEITTFTTQMTQWKLKSDENAKLIEEKEAIILQKTDIINRLKKLVAGLKNELDMAHSLSLQFKITKEEKMESHERAAESMQIAIEAKKESLEIDMVKQTTDASELKYVSLKTEFDKMAEEIGRLRGELETSKAKMVGMSTELTSIQTEKLSLSAQCESFKMQASKSTEVEKSFMQSAETQVSTYHDEINDAYNSIGATFGEIESELA